MSDPVADAAAKAKKVTVDGQTVERHSLSEQIEAERHAAAKTAGTAANMGIRLGQFRNKGTT